MAANNNNNMVLAAMDPDFPQYWIASHANNLPNIGNDGSLAWMMMGQEADTFSNNPTNNDRMVTLGPAFDALSSLVLPHMHGGVQGFLAAAPQWLRVHVTPNQANANQKGSKFGLFSGSGRALS